MMVGHRFAPTILEDDGLSFLATHEFTQEYDLTESESMLIGRGFGVGKDIKTGPNGNLYVVSLTGGTIYEIHRKVTN